MYKDNIQIQQDNSVSSQNRGLFKAFVISNSNNYPIKDAVVKIFTEDNMTTPIAELNTDENGQTDESSFETPPLEFSLEPFSQRPYSKFVIEVSAKGYETVYINGVEILPSTIALQNIVLNPIVEEDTAITFVIPEHTLYGDYPPKIAETEIKPVTETGEIVLSRVVIPEYIIVHDGPPNDLNANNYYVLYKDYIKNVASCEIYATWKEAAIQANVLAIMSFTLNRVYTEFYRNKGYDFTITSSTAFDQKWVNGKNVFDSISKVVDVIFSNYLSRPGITQPILTQYCDGKKVVCPKFLSQWGSKELADEGYSAIEILRYYYGDDIYINTAEEISGVPASWPRYDLTIGSTGDKVRQMQSQLNEISNAYPMISKIVVDGVYGSNTANSVKKFQQIFGLSQTGEVDFTTWYKISEVYVGVSKIAELA